MIIDDYNPDKPQNANKGNDDYPRRVAIDDRTPLSEENPKFKNKYTRHRESGVNFMKCPECGMMGLHRPTRLDFPNARVQMGGEVCDICGYQDTYEIAF